MLVSGVGSAAGANSNLVGQVEQSSLSSEGTSKLDLVAILSEANRKIILCTPQVGDGQHVSGVSVDLF